MVSRPNRVTATGTAFDAGAATECTMIGARLVAGSAAATATIRETDGSGTILAELSAPAAAATDEFVIPVTFRQKVHVTLAGTGAACVVYVG